jgi:hypothetical protein
MADKVSAAWCRVVLSALLTALMAWLRLAADSTPPDVAAFSGHTTAVLGITTTLTESKPIPLSGSAQACLPPKSVLEVLNVDSGPTITTGQTDRARSEACVPDVIPPVGKQHIAPGLAGAQEDPWRRKRVFEGIGAWLQALSRAHY